MSEVTNSLMSMQELFNLAFARLDRAAERRREFSQTWGQYIDTHPWDVDLRAVEPTTFEILAVMREPAPLDLSMIFSEWLAALRAALDNGFYAWVAAATGQNPPPSAARLQFPICSTPTEYRRHTKRLVGIPPEIMDAVEGAQPYQSPSGSESNLFYWLHELARTDRHRTPHVGIGRVAEHRVRIGVPEGVTAIFDETVDPFNPVRGELIIARFRTNRALEPLQITADLRGVGVDPEIDTWAGFRLGGKSHSLWERMTYTELFTRNHLENMAYAHAVPPGGFTTFEPPPPSCAAAKTPDPAQAPGPV